MTDQKTIQGKQYRPQAGAQESFIHSDADIAIYGGAAGGGKSWALLYESMRYADVSGYGAVIFRRTSPQIRNEGGLWDESQEMFLDRGGVPLESTLTWKFPVFGTKIKFAHLEYDKTRHDWQGSQIPFIGFDELTHFTEKQFFYMLSRNRSVCGVKPYIRATTNPSSSSWVRQLVDWWIDPKTGLAIESRSGVVRYFIRLAGKLHFTDSPEEMREQFGDDIEFKSLTFIKASISDNKILMEKDPAYLANLRALPDVERQQLEDGNWNAEPEGDIYKSELFGTYTKDDCVNFDRLIVTADTAEKTAEHNAYSVFALFATRYGDKNLYVLDLIRFKEEIKGLEQRAIGFFNKHHTRRFNNNAAMSYFGIEDKSSGTQLLQLLQGKIGVSAIKREADKKNNTSKKWQRADAVANRLTLDGCQILLPSEPTYYTNAEWVSEYKNELKAAQKDGEDKGFWDQVDVTSDAAQELGLLKEIMLDASALTMS